MSTIEDSEIMWKIRGLLSDILDELRAMRSDLHDLDKRISTIETPDGWNDDAQNGGSNE